MKKPLGYHGFSRFPKEIPGVAWDVGGLMSFVEGRVAQASLKQVP